MKKPLSLALQSLLRSRRADAGASWLGLARGRLLPDAPRQRMWDLLEGLDWAAMPNEGKLRGAMAERSFKLGLSTKARPT